MPLFISPNTDHVWGNYSTNYQNETKYLFKGLSTANYYALHWFLKELLWVPLTLYLMGGGIECLPLAKTAPVH